MLLCRFLKLIFHNQESEVAICEYRCTISNLNRGDLHLLVLNVPGYNSPDDDLYCPINALRAWQQRTNAHSNGITGFLLLRPITECRWGGEDNKFIRRLMDLATPKTAGAFVLGTFLWEQAMTDEAQERFRNRVRDLQNDKRYWGAMTEKEARTMRLKHADFGRIAFSSMVEAANGELISFGEDDIDLDESTGSDATSILSSEQSIAEESLNRIRLEREARLQEQIRAQEVASARRQAEHEESINRLRTQTAEVQRSRLEISAQNNKRIELLNWFNSVVSELRELPRPRNPRAVGRNVEHQMFFVDEAVKIGIANIQLVPEKLSLRMRACSACFFAIGTTKYKCKYHQFLASLTKLTYL